MSSLVPSSNVILECFSYKDTEFPPGPPGCTRPVPDGRRGPGPSLDSAIPVHRQAVEVKCTVPLTGLRPAVAVGQHRNLREQATSAREAFELRRLIQ